MKANDILSLFIIFALSFTLGGCDAGLNSVAVINTFALQSSKLPGEIKPLKADLTEKEPVAILFLIDTSASVVGQGAGQKCNLPIPTKDLPHVGMYYIARVLSNLPLESSTYIHVGVSQFGSTYRSVIPLAPGNTLGDSPGMSILDEGIAYTDDDTDYATALREAYRDIKKYSDATKITKQIILLLTDGVEVRDDTENALAEIPLSVQIYANLVCPDTQGDTSFWAKHRIPTSKFPDEWLTDFWEHPDIKQALPTNSAWISGKSMSEISIRGDINQVNFKYWSWRNPATSQFKIDGNIVDENNAPIDKIPRQGCADHEFQLESRSTDAGFWWADIKIPFVDEVTLSSQKLINDLPIEITAHLAGNDFSSGETENWRDCYKPENFNFEFANLEEQILKIVPCGDNGKVGLCPEADGNSLYAKWRWYPPTLERSANIPIIVSLNMTDAANNPKSIRSESYTIPVRFRPKNTLVTPNFKESDDKELFVDLKFTFDSETGHPDIYLLRTGQIQSSTQQPTLQPCPSTTTFTGIPNPAYFVQQNTPNDLLAKASSSWQGILGTYQLVVKRYVIDQCGFEKVLFIWRESSTYQIANTQWICDLRKFECEE